MLFAWPYLHVTLSARRCTSLGTSQSNIGSSELNLSHLLLFAQPLRKQSKISCLDLTLPSSITSSSVPPTTWQDRELTAPQETIALYDGWLTSMTSCCGSSSDKAGGYLTPVAPSRSEIRASSETETLMITLPGPYSGQPRHAVILTSALMLPKISY